ncbi:MAG TPA: cytochrome-c oxidase, cbb3-type subunit III [Bauldia sp.]|nr:cytochrome-c oxidase, cbb3-type subunit III [Bauldia sp.]
MSDEEAPKIDPVTGIATTGHDWDGVTELNHPLPRWWLWIFYGTIVFALGYWILYPSWPLISGAVGGVFGWHSRAAVVEEVGALRATRAPMVAQLAGVPIDKVSSDAALFDFTLAYGRAAFGDNCAPCHGPGGGGARGYPNLVDDDWLWGGTLDAIETTITHGVRNENADSRPGSMPAFGRDGTLTAPEIATVAQYVRSLAGFPVPSGTDLAAGKALFVQHCVLCHGPDGRGKRDVGSANLTDAVWLYGSDFNTLVATITNGRGGSMPDWSARLDPTTIKALAVYVHSLGGGE